MLAPTRRARGCALAWLSLHSTVSFGDDPGSAAFVETEVRVATKSTLTLVYTVGADGLRAGDQLRVHDPALHGMRWSLWGDLSPWAEDCTAFAEDVRDAPSWGRVTATLSAADEEATVALSRSNCGDGPGSCQTGGEDAWTAVTVESGALVAGDQITLVLGDVSATAGEDGPSRRCGLQTPTRAYPQLAFPAEICPAGDPACTALESPRVDTVASPVVDRLLVLGPSQALTGEPFAIKVALLDAHGNPVMTDDRAITLSLPEDPEREPQTWTFSPSDEGWHDFTVRADAEGVLRYQVEAGDLSATSNPVEITAEAPEYAIYWGDVHMHNGYSWTDEDGAVRNESMAYARDIARLDIASESQKASPAEAEEAAESESLWEDRQDECVSWTEAGAFLVLLGFEWMGDASTRVDGTTYGHHNVYYDTCEAPIATHDTDEIQGLDGDAGLWSWLRAAEQASGARAVAVPHAMRNTGYNFDLSDPELELLAEVWSTWGDQTSWSEDDEEALAGGTVDLLRRGLRMGWIAASDSHAGWLGNPADRYNVQGGLGAWLAPSLTRGAVFDAMRARRTYATSGHRPILHLEVVDGDAVVQQGSELIADQPSLRYRLHGTDEISALSVWRLVLAPDALPEAISAREPQALNLRDELALGWDGETEVAIWLEATQVDGARLWSSPIWLTDDCGRLAEGALDPAGRCAVDTGGEEGAEGRAEAPRTGGCATGDGPRGGLGALLAVGAVLGRARRLRGLA